MPDQLGLVGTWCVVRKEEEGEVWRERQVGLPSQGRWGWPAGAGEAVSVSVCLVASLFVRGVQFCNPCELGKPWRVGELKKKKNPYNL